MTRTQLGSGQIKGVDLANGDDVTGILPEANGGTGASSITGAGIVDTGSAQTISGQKTLTGPKINQIKDTNGNLMIDLAANANAVNYFEFDNGATNFGPIIYAWGTDPTVDLRLATKSGQVTIDNVPAVTTTGTQDLTGKRATLAAGSTTVAPLKLTSGTNLTTPAAGAVEYDGVTFSGTIDTTSGRALNAMDQMFRLSADGSALGPTIADYFGSNSAFPYVAGGVYEIVWYLMYTKTTGAVVTYTITSTTAPVNLNAWYTQSAIAGIGTQAAAITAGIVFDDFDGPAGRLPDPAVWAPWLSADKDYTSAHTDYPRNACLDGNGNLAITAIRETVKDPRLGGRSVGTRRRCSPHRAASSACTAPGRRGSSCHRARATTRRSTCGAPATTRRPTRGPTAARSTSSSCRTRAGLQHPRPRLRLATRHADQRRRPVRRARRLAHLHLPPRTRQADNPDRRRAARRGVHARVLPKGKAWVFNQPLFAVLDLSVGTGTNKPDGQPFPVAMLVDWIRHEPLCGTRPTSGAPPTAAGSSPT
jgi:hypothetical protein